MQQAKCTQIGEETRSVQQGGNLRYTQSSAWSLARGQGLLMWTRDRIHLRMGDSLREVTTNGLNA